jgi:hypothetical protein
MHKNPNFVGTVRKIKDQPNSALTQLLSREGGCVSVHVAADLLGFRDPPASRLVLAAVKRGELIAVRDGNGDLVLPRWQFSRRGVRAGIPEIMRILQKHPHFSGKRGLPLLLMLSREHAE